MDLFGYRLLLKTEIKKHCNKIIFKYINNIIRLDFEKKKLQNFVLMNLVNNYETKKKKFFYLEMHKTHFPIDGFIYFNLFCDNYAYRHVLLCYIKSRTWFLSSRHWPLDRNPTLKFLSSGQFHEIVLWQREIGLIWCGFSKTMVNL